MPALSLPLVPDSDEAREWARDELSRGVYSDSPSVWEWLWEKVLELIETIVDAGSGLDSIFLPLIVLAVIAGVVLLALVLGGPVRRRRAHAARVGGVWHGQDLRSSAQLGAAAADAAAARDFTLATIEQFRAIVRWLEEQDLVHSTAGATALEVAITAGAEVPDFADRLRSGAAVFNESLYGTRPATHAQYTALRELAGALEAARRPAPQGVGSR